MISSQRRMDLLIQQGGALQSSEQSINDDPNVMSYFEMMESHNQDMGSYKQFTPRFLDKSGVTSFQRFLLKSWLLEEMDKFRFLRETYTTTSKFIDAFLLKQKQAFPIGSFQHLGIACWMLASKICGQRLPPISFAKYDKEQILQFQKNICVRLNFKLHPLTYSCFAGILTSLWDVYSSIYNVSEEVRYFADSQKSVLLYRNLLQILDGLDLVPLSYQFTIEELVLNCFYLENKQNYSQCQHPKNENQIRQVLSLNGEYEACFREFLQFVNKKCKAFQKINVSEECMKYIMPYLNRGCKDRQLAKWQIQKLQLVRNVQTQNKEMCKLARNIIKTSPK